MSQTHLEPAPRTRGGCTFGCLSLPAIGTAIVLYLSEPVRDWVAGKALDSGWDNASDHLGIILIITLIGTALLGLAWLTEIGSRQNDREAYQSQLDSLTEENTQLRFESQRRLNIINLMSSYQGMLDRILLAENGREAAKRLAKEFLRDIGKAIDPTQGIQYRGSIWHRVGDYLVPFETYEMASNSARSEKFYVGAGNQHPSGTAGAVFRSGRLHVVHVWRNEQGDWMSDDPEHFVSSKPSDQPRQYTTFIALPMKPQSEASPIGVLCLDSNANTTFDSPQVQLALSQISDHFGQAIAIFEVLGLLSTEDE